MRELGLLGASDGINQGFEDVFELSVHCRYADCGHTQEPGCAVLAAVGGGELSEDRYASFMKLKKESEYHGMSYVEKRKRDRAFGRFIKSAKKQMKD
jgi:ribosome biogenesis GTPase